MMMFWRDLRQQIVVDEVKVVLGQAEEIGQEQDDGVGGVDALEAADGADSEHMGLSVLFQSVGSLREAESSGVEAGVGSSNP